MYAKVFTSLFDGSMRGHADLILVFVNLLCHADQDGTVDRHWQAVSDETGLSVQRVRAALVALEGPDVDSRTRTADGRRIQRIDEARTWGWTIVNFKKYRDLRNQEERRVYMRELMRERRQKEAVSRSVSICKQPLAKLANTDADTEAEALSARAGGQGGPFSEALAAIRSARPDWPPVSDALILAELRRAPAEALSAAVAEFCADAANESIPPNLTRMLRGYMRQAGRKDDRKSEGPARWKGYVPQLPGEKA